MAKEMLSARIDSGLRDALAGEAAGEGRSVSNMLERILGERYSVLAGRDKPVTAAENGVSERVVDAPTSTTPPRPASAEDAVARVAALRLASPGGKCRADVAHGTRCKLCGKVH